MIKSVNERSRMMASFWGAGVLLAMSGCDVKDVEKPTTQVITQSMDKLSTIHLCVNSWMASEGDESKVIIHAATSYLFQEAAALYETETAIRVLRVDRTAGMDDFNHRMTPFFSTIERELVTSIPLKDREKTLFLAYNYLINAQNRIDELCPIGSDGYVKTHQELWANALYQHEVVYQLVKSSPIRKHITTNMATEKILQDEIAKAHQLAAQRYGTKEGLFPQ